MYTKGSLLDEVSKTSFILELSLFNQTNVISLDRASGQISADFDIITSAPETARYNLYA